METEEKNVEEKAFPAVQFTEFEPTTYEAWKEEAIVSLKGGDFQKKLFTKTFENITLEPIYTPAHMEKIPALEETPGTGSFRRGIHAAGYRSHPWRIAQEIGLTLPEEANSAAKLELEKGATALRFALNGATLAGENPSWVKETGVSITTLEDMEKLLSGMDADIPLYVYAGASAASLVSLLAAAMTKKGDLIKHTAGCVGADPLGYWAQEGQLGISLDQLYDEAAHCVVWAGKNTPALRTLLVRGGVYHEGGANSVQELAYAFSTAIAYMNALRQRGLTADQIASQIMVEVHLGSNYFMEIAKLRAARMLWSQIAAAFGCSEENRKLHLLARTAAFNKTVYDPYVNMLRTTTEAFSAVVGGIEALTVAPFDEVIRPSDTFSRRISRNIQIMLQGECHLLQPVDPAGGSWYVETLTQQLAEAAWKLIQETEEAGGVEAALKTGKIQQDINAVLQERFKKLDRRADVAVGNNMYPNPGEELLLPPEETQQPLRSIKEAILTQEQKAALLQAAAGTAGDLPPALMDVFYSGASLGEIREVLNDGMPGETDIVPISRHRWTEQFEELRQCTERYKAKTGENLKVFQANMGPIPQHKARADFSRGFLEVAAFEVLKNDGFPSVEEAVAAAKESGADVTVICSTDATYPELVPPLAKQLKEACPKMSVLLAGAAPPELEPVYREAGVDDFVHVRANCRKILQAIQEAKGMI